MGTNKSSVFVVDCGMDCAGMKGCSKHKISMEFSRSTDIVVLRVDGDATHYPIELWEAILKAWDDVP